jgi:type II secretory pathway component PulF
MQEADTEKILFTPNILQMIEAGERTSTVDVVARKIAEQYRRQVEIAISMMTKFIEPIAILIAGLFVLWFALAIFSTIMQITAGVNVS